MELKDIQTNSYHRTHSGSICKVTAINAGDETTVAYIPYTDGKAGEPDEMPAVLFTANLEEAVDAVDPHGKPMPDEPAAPV